MVIYHYKKKEKKNKAPYVPNFFLFFLINNFIITYVNRFPPCPYEVRGPPPLWCRAPFRGGGALRACYASRGG